MLRKSVLTIIVILVFSACSTAAPRGKAGDKGRSAAEVNVALGQRYLEQGRLELALEKLERALENDSSYIDAHTVIAVLYERINDGPKAALHYRRAAELGPKIGAVNNNYGAFLCRSGKLDESSRYFERATADPFYKTPDVALTNFGTCLLQAGRFDPAEQNFSKALAHNPANAEALFHLAGIQFRKSEFLRARAFLQRFDALGQANAEALLLGHKIEQSLGNKREAGEYARRLRSEFPDSQQIRELESSTPS